ncbi:Serine/threonine-protein kinase TEL1 [Frankliniella fusca]|uniref:Serine/threonine-protein kinase TEL1 n=1 Tax=Frankliniella fusca TaxID=407009 RepID=A0AAE1I232_9NEOP|nr:Serine/threonine-protein kinase TEL1 [Frankliniella fusca]KAK3931525.1 Serine/threonine-protein kinase TEL1 [Frankliniella fusca]
MTKFLCLLALCGVVTAYDSKCPRWQTCSIYTKEELSTIYYNSKYCMNLVPDKMIGNRFGFDSVRDLCLSKGLDVVNYRGGPKEDEAEEISNCVAKYYGMSVVAPTFTCLQQALSKDISEMERIPYSAAQKQTIMGMVDKCLELEPDETPRADCRAVATSILETGTQWKANIPRSIKNRLYEGGYDLRDDVKVAVIDCLTAALEKPLST